jgi:hypothetical protein
MRESQILHQIRFQSGTWPPMEIQQGSSLGMPLAAILNMSPCWVGVLMVTTDCQPWIMGLHSGHESLRLSQSFFLIYLAKV